MKEINKFKEPMRALFRGLEGEDIICDITIGKPRTTVKTFTSNSKEIIRFPASRKLGVKFKLDNNEELIEKVKGLKRRRLIWISLREENRPLAEYDGDVVTKILTNDEYLELYKIQKEKEKELRKMDKHF